MTEPVLVDTGPLVAVVARRDAHHAACTEQLRALRQPMLTTWPVLTETAWLLRGTTDGFQAVVEMLGGGLVEIADLPPESYRWLGDFLDRYASAGAQLADASLVYLAERRGIGTVFTP